MQNIGSWAFVAGYVHAAVRWGFSIYSLFTYVANCDWAFGNAHTLSTMEKDLYSVNGNDVLGDCTHNIADVQTFAGSVNGGDMLMSCTFMRTGWVPNVY